MAQSFDMDFTRENKDRRQFGKTESTETLLLDKEYSVSQATPPLPPADVPPPADKKFTHKLSNGTVLEAPSIEELATKIEKAFAQTPTKEVPVEFDAEPLYKPYQFKRKELTLSEQADILNIWKENPQKALRLLQEADLGAPVEVIVQKLNEAQAMVQQRTEEEAGVEFIFQHDDYRATPENGKALTAYLREKGKPITVKNLDLAFRQMVAAGNKTLLRQVDATTGDETGVQDTPPPPVIVPSNQGAPPTPETSQIDVAKFAAMTLDQQKQYFANLKRRPN